jgi:methanol--5-hydroxybenzimidazolylcobamide Co-methyltransferase
MKFTNLSISDASELIFGFCKKPVETKRGLIIGGGKVYPELNFTLPPVTISKNNLKTITKHYKDIVSGALERALHLYSPGVILEFETLIEMTKEPEIGIEIVKVMNDICEDYFQKHKLKSEIRLIPNDLREFERPPKARTSS